MLFSLVLSLVNCKKNTIENPIVKKNETSTPTAIAIAKDTSNYHVDTTYQYENRTGTSGHYKYNYDVIGFDSKGTEVHGNISIEGKEGNGFLMDTNHNKINIKVEWTGHGKLKAMDSRDNQYDLVVE